MPLRKALFGACLALPLAASAGAAQARSPELEQVIRVPAGSVVLVLPGAAGPQVPTKPLPELRVMPAFPPDLPALHMIAMENAMMQQMLQQVRALDDWSMSLPNPKQIIGPAPESMPAPDIAPGTGVMTTLVSDGHGVCRQTVTYRMPANGAPPQVHMVRGGNECRALHLERPIGVMQTLPPRPEPPHSVPAAAPHYPPLWTVVDPTRPMQPSAPRT